MIRVKAVIGVCALCAFVFSAVAVQSAAGAVNGTTGFTCKEKKEPGGVGFADAHCSTAVGTGAKFEHVAIPEGVETKGTGTNAKTAGETTASTLEKIRGSLSGVEVEIQATEAEATASGTNKLGAEHYIEGTGVAKFSGVTVTKPAGKGCKVTGGTVTTKLLRATSLGQGMEGKLEPAEGTVFASVSIEGCSIASLNNTFPVTGSIKCPGVGATTSCTHAATTAQNTLKFGGTKVGVEGVATASGPENIPLVATTVET
jgi:hypothetical protein